MNDSNTNLFCEGQVGFEKGFYCSNVLPVIIE